MGQYRAGSSASPTLDRGSLTADVWAPVSALDIPFYQASASSPSVCPNFKVPPLADGSFLALEALSAPQLEGY